MHESKDSNFCWIISWNHRQLIGHTNLVWSGIIVYSRMCIVANSLPDIIRHNIVSISSPVYKMIHCFDYRDYILSQFSIELYVYTDSSFQK